MDGGSGGTVGGRPYPSPLTGGDSLCWMVGPTLESGLGWDEWGGRLFLWTRARLMTVAQRNTWASLQAQPPAA